MTEHACQHCRRPNREQARFCGGCGALLREAQSLAILLLPGTGLGEGGRYRIVRELGRGGFGYAFEAHDEILDRACVVKQLRLNPNWSDPLARRIAQSFAREARILATLNTPGHPHIPEIYDFLPERLCLVMKFITGKTLFQMLKEQVEPLAQETALEYARVVCSALAYMHAHKPEPILHRDLKPQNLILDKADRLWLIDFGLARGVIPGAQPASGEETGGQGTPGYTPPEQWLGQAEPRSDIYALTATLYELLTNRRPPPAANELNQPILPDTLHPAVAALVRHGLAMEVTARPEAAALLDRIEAVLAILHVPPPPPPAQPPPATGAVGRRAEIEAVETLLERAGQAWISGMPGVGKTTVAALAMGDRPKGPALWHQAHNIGGGESLLWTLAEYGAWNGAPALWQQIQRARRDGVAPPPIPNLATGLTQILRQCGGTICIDDAQHYFDDPGATLILEHLRDLASEGAIRLIVTARELPAWAPLEGRLALAGLSLEETALFCSRHGAALQPEELERLHSATAGNSQLLILALDLLARGGGAGDLVSRLAQAAHVEEYLLREVDARLEPDARAVMEAISALLDHAGSRALIEQLAETERIARVLADLCRRNLLTRVDGAEQRYQQHAILQAFYYQQLRGTERIALHGRAAAWYAGEGADPVIAARHALLAGDLRHAFELLTTDPTRLISAGQARAMEPLLKSLAGAAHEPAQQAAVLVAQGEVATWLREGEAARAAFGEAFTLLRGQADTPAAQELVARACEGMGALLEHENPAEAMVWVEQGVELVARTPTLLARLERRRGAIAIAMGEYEQATAALEASLALDSGSARLRADALTDLGVISCIQGNFDPGEALLEQAATIYRKLDLIGPLSSVQSNLAQIREIKGDWEGAAIEYERILRLEQQLGATAQMIGTMLQLGLLQMRRGDDSLAAGWLGQAIDRSRLHGLREYQVNSLASSADLALRRGDLDTARGLLREAAGLAKATQNRAQLPEIAWLEGQLALAQGDIVTARARAEEAVALAEELELSIERGVALRVLGETKQAKGELEAAIASFTSSIEALGDDPYETARTQLLLGQALIANGDEEAGRALIEEARATFGRLGARRDLIRAQEAEEQVS